MSRLEFASFVAMQGILASGFEGDSAAIAKRSVEVAREVIKACDLTLRGPKSAGDANA